MLCAVELFGCFVRMNTNFDEHSKWYFMSSMSNACAKNRRELDVRNLVFIRTLRRFHA